MTPAEQSQNALALCQMAPVIPVLVIEDLAHAVPLAQALVAGGLPVLEVTLRTDCALEAIAEMARIEGAVVGAGTVLTPEQMADARAAGARFAVAPGATSALIDAARLNEMPLLPGAQTCSEVMSLMEQGYTVQKFFPAEAIGGANALKSIAGPLPQVTFCPTGVISAARAPDYLALPNVACVGGSWVAPKDAMAAGDWDAITRLARAASELPR
ncbi:bifunctional 4-hydroxy-2-oxoglutarate aldolase/2-dehydro-3-deoxy-phosphogluconate aldolase [Roseinatronobacter bogoriensis]|uniref:2-dehydro-3-deoxy-phosphogluconate aldolase n=1 Tax=Roseinatronobacter bogoriensis subsp. barguzinensis TaxID=441209 RepID=A0A2K8KB78_9RHOB|nr:MULTISPECIES: bifunctional 4-hydroxy-2-oxoglutarate aldolase/2-dehydro-3-deoxy-phosphogluconate aldolase [Rhodobaca]ATX66691.1 keto-deoxy-phosphogluconate aldolase [Rhodobaca barguzinensis]MBB4207876.1 2-dehydro-3-deoxyphosphogluconate aldolase/(4S)-4-hydroxy-2-oxoglutarate aldolase [Rhodobaca bogoriensis DSM 18756]TDW39819.1 2-dehydro-3-deoxyphosphogluconate aldolase/(4S)-4-hydroxy-2-oxoglutarate aldolase [Rhodobaca barguzinensis]TDY71028.1 2-keto-3-deoxy-phosphogluconate aldolase [Rhodobac